jgi:hypothetical protein
LGLREWCFELQISHSLKSGELRVSDPSYQERYCALVDIFAFRDLIADIEREWLTFEEVRDVLRAAQERPQDYTLAPGYGFNAADLRQQSISNAICISSAPSGPGLMHLFRSLQFLAMRLLAKSYFTRGAVVKGRLYHDDKMVFVDALISAHGLEQTVVRHPRIMVMREIALDVDTYSSNEILSKELSNFIGKSTDGPYYLHILRGLTILYDETLDPDTRAMIVERSNDTAAKIQKRFDDSADSPDYFEKVRWFANYWNDSITNHPELNRIWGPGLDPPPLGINLSSFAIEHPAA